MATKGGGGGPFFRKGKKPKTEGEGVYLSVLENGVFRAAGHFAGQDGAAAHAARAPAGAWRIEFFCRLGRYAPIITCYSFGTWQN